MCVSVCVSVCVFVCVCVCVYQVDGLLARLPSNAEHAAARAQVRLATADHFSSYIFINLQVISGFIAYKVCRVGAGGCSGCGGSLALGTLGPPAGGSYVMLMCDTERRGPCVRTCDDNARPPRVQALCQHATCHM